MNYKEIRNGLFFLGNIMKQKVYLDLDGVLADFDTYYYQLFGKTSASETDKKLWSNINSLDYFFRDLPLMNGALDFFHDIRELTNEDPIFLTACPRSNYEKAALEKIEWVRNNFGDRYQVLPVLGGKTKCLFMHARNDILIDDFEKNILPWRLRGGIGIHHITNEVSLYQLRENYGM